MNESAAMPRDQLSRRLAIAYRALAWASLLLCALHAHDAVGAVVLVGPLVLAPAGYLLVLVIAAVSIGLAFASWMNGKARRAASDEASDDGSAAPVRPVRGRVVRWLVNGTAALALSVSVPVAGFECLLAAPYIAKPTGPAGDRVVVVERNVLLAGCGDVYLIPGGIGVGRKIASYSADYIAKPTGPAGDRVVVVERNVLLAGCGDVYLIPGGIGVGRKIASYSADDGYSPMGPAGDRVVVVERNVLLAGCGDVYLIPGGIGVGRKIASYSADDGYSPMGNGTYALEWRGSEPCFTAYGAPANPVGMHPAD